MWISVEFFVITHMRQSRGDTDQVVCRLLSKESETATIDTTTLGLPVDQLTEQFVGSSNRLGDYQ